MSMASTADEAAAAVDAAAAKGTETLNDTMDKASKGFEKLVAFQKDTLEALMASATAATKAAEEIQAEIAAYAKTAAEEMKTASKSVFGAKTLQEAFEAQSAYAKSSFESYVGEMTKVSEMWLGATRQAMEPIQTRAKAFMDMMKVAA